MSKKITVGELIDLLKKFDQSLYVTSCEYHGYTSYMEAPHILEHHNKEYIHMEGINIYELRENPKFLDDKIVNDR
jgi:hypothetical protein